MKEVREQKLCDQRRQIEEKHWSEELQMETIKQKIDGQSTKDTEVAPVVQIVPEEEYIELFGTVSDDETFDGDWSEIGLESTEETPKTQSVEDDSIEVAESDRTNEGEELQERNLTEEQQAILFRIKEVLKSRTREALPSLKTCDKRIVQTETSRISNVVQYTANITDCNNLLYAVALVVSE